MCVLLVLGNLEHYFVLASYVTVTCPMFGCCRAEYSALDFREMTYRVRNTWFDSGYICAAVHLAFGRISHNFYVDVDSEPEVLRSHAEWRSVLSYASGYCPCTRSDPEFLRAARGWHFA